MIKVNPWCIVVAHWRTFGDENGERKFFDVLIFYLLPIMTCAIYWYRGWRPLPTSIWNGGLTVAAIFIPLIFTVVATLLASTRDFEEGSLERKLLRQLVDNSAYVILVLVLFVGLIFICDWYYSEGSPRKIGCAVFLGFVGHIALTTLMVLRRVHIFCSVIMTGRKK